MKLLSLFSGIGAFEKALKNLNMEYELVGYSEIDKYASKAYSLIHGESETKNLGDITKIKVDDLPKNIDLITYGFPCQDISVAGKRQGLIDSDGKKTRSGLFFNALNVIQATKPKIAIAENVKNLTGKRFKNEFELILESLNDVGYNNYYKVLNAKDYGIPQNRERVFIVSIRKDIDNGKFEFPKPIELTKRLKDVLENEVDEKYYLKDLAMTFFIKNSFEQEKFRFDSTNKLIQVGTLNIKGQDNIKRVYSSEGISPTLTNMQGGNRQPKIIRNNKLVEKAYSDFLNKNGYIPKRFNAYNKREIKDIAPTQTTRCGNIGSSAAVLIKDDKFRIRKLTPKECFRLMGFEDKDIDILIENKTSDTQLYKMAGNSIVVDVLEHIFKATIQNYSFV